MREIPNKVFTTVNISSSQLTASASPKAILVLKIALLQQSWSVSDNLFVVYQGSSLTRGKQKPADAKTQQLAEQAYEELLDYIETVPRNYVLDDSK